MTKAAELVKEAANLVKEGFLGVRAGNEVYDAIRDFATDPEGAAFLALVALTVDEEVAGELIRAAEEHREEGSQRVFDILNSVNIGVDDLVPAVVQALEAE